MKVLMHAPNPLLDSGMGKVGNELAAGMADEGHEVHLFAPGVTVPEQEHNGYILHGIPGGGEPPAVGMFGRVLDGVDPDLIVSNRNWQSLDWLSQPLNDHYRGSGSPTPVLFYGPPVEAEGKPPLFEHNLLDDHLNEVWMCPFTENRYYAMRDDWDVENYLLPEAHEGSWVPHGVDHDVFNPEANENDDAPGLREGLGLDGRFMACIVAENWRRKNLDLLFDAWSRFSEKVMDSGDKRPILAMQVDPGASRGGDQFYSGWNYHSLAFGYDLQPARTIEQIDDECDVFTNKRFVGDYDPREVVAGIMAASDLYVLPTSGEAFSLTSLEAMACGTPILQTRVETLEWLCGDAAVYIETVQDHALNTGERMPTPSVTDMADKLWRLYDDAEARSYMAEQGVERAQDFSWERTGEEFAAAAEHVEEVSEW